MVPYMGSSVTRTIAALVCSQSEYRCPRPVPGLSGGVCSLAHIIHLSGSLRLVDIWGRDLRPGRRGASPALLSWHGHSMLKCKQASSPCALPLPSPSSSSSSSPWPAKSRRHGRVSRFEIMTRMADWRHVGRHLVAAASSSELLCWPRTWDDGELEEPAGRSRGLSTGQGLPGRSEPESAVLQLCAPGEVAWLDGHLGRIVPASRSLTHPSPPPHVIPDIHLGHLGHLCHLHARDCASNTPCLRPATLLCVQLS